VKGRQSVKGRAADCAASSLNLGGSESLCVCVLFEFRNFTAANAKGHDPAVIEHVTCALDSAAGPTDDKDAVSRCYEFAWFEGLDFNVSIQLLKVMADAAWAFVGSGVVGHCARQMPDHVFGN
jgi:hypothetical protein